MLKDGIKQGSDLTFYLLVCFIDPLIREIRLSKIGCYIGNIACNVVSYVDEVMLLSTTLKG